MKTNDLQQAAATEIDEEPVSKANQSRMYLVCVLQWASHDIKLHNLCLSLAKLI